VHHAIPPIAVILYVIRKLAPKIRIHAEFTTGLARGYPTSEELGGPGFVADHLKLGIRSKSKDGMVFVVCKSRQDDDDNQQHVRIVP